MVCACFYDENDNFRNKLWVLTSYDASRKEEDKLRKVVSEETAFKKEVNSSSPLQYSLEKGVTLSTFSPDSCLLYTSPSPRDRQKSRMPSSA